MTFNLPIFSNRSNELANNRSIIKNAFDEFFNDFTGLSFPFFEEKTRSFIPRLNISETDKHYFIEAELPGIKRDNLELKLDNNLLTIKGKAEETKESKERNYFVRECRYGAFQRSLSLPSNVNENEINANFNDGILNISIEKKHENSIKKIDIKTR